MNLKFAFRNLFRNHRRSLATMLAVIFGFAGLVMLGGYIHRSYMGLRASSVYMNQKGHVAILKKGAIDSFLTRPKRHALTIEDQKVIEQEILSLSDLIEFTEKSLTTPALLSGGKSTVPVYVTGVQTDVYKRALAHPMMQRWAWDWSNPANIASAEALFENPRGISVTKPLSILIHRQFPFQNLSGEDRSFQLAGKSFYGDLNAVEVELTSTHTTGMALSEDTSLLAPLPVVQDLLATDAIESWVLFLKDAGQTRSVVQTLKNHFQKRNLPFEVYPYDDESWSPYFVGTMNFLFVMAFFFVVLILGAVILTLMNTTTLNLLERAREIGTLRAVGYEKKHLVQLLRTENLILVAISLVFGAILAALLSSIINGLYITFEPPGSQGKIQFYLSHEPLIYVVLGIVLLLITWVTSDVLVRRFERKQIVHLLTS